MIGSAFFLDLFYDKLCHEDNVQFTLESRKWFHVIYLVIQCGKLDDCHVISFKLVIIRWGGDFF